MRNDIKIHRQKLIEFLNAVQATDQRGNMLLVEEAIENAINIILEQADKGGKLMVIGNGGSAAIASHMAIDFWKNAGIKALAFNDGALLTCVSNDHGYSHVFEKSIEMFAEYNDVLLAFSSSGNSENILRGVVAAQEKQGRIITFSGFKEDNLLRKTGEINFYVPVAHYGFVEVIHHALCHCFIDVIIQNKSKLTEKATVHESH